MKQRIHIYIFLALSILILSWEVHQMKPVQADEVFIPEESIRLRILANSNSPLDQRVKWDIRNAVNAQITQWVEQLDDVEDARKVIDKNIDVLNGIVAEKLEEAGSKENFNISLTETSFPTKLYGDRLYPAGEYEAVLIEVGDGQGDNWWCVLFPPLCFLDFSNGDAVAHETEDAGEENIEEKKEVEVSFFLVEVFNNIIDRFRA